MSEPTVAVVTPHLAIVDADTDRPRYVLHRCPGCGERLARIDWSWDGVRVEAAGRVSAAEHLGREDVGPEHIGDPVRETPGGVPRRIAADGGEES